MNKVLGAALLVTPFLFEADTPALVGLSVRRGAVHSHYGRWSEAIV
jgi:hypothetical protein